MSSIISMESQLVKADGARFCNYAGELNTTIRSIDAEIDEIVSRGLSGNANDALCRKYMDIKTSALRFANTINALGQEIQNSAVSKTNIDEESAQSINNIGSIQ